MYGLSSSSGIINLKELVGWTVGWLANQLVCVAYLAV